MSDHPFWCDDFDADLLKVVPEARERIGAFGNVKLWTYCSHPTHGRINLPTSWHSVAGLTAFFWSEDPKHDRDAHGWVMFGCGYTTNAPLLECTWLEVLRDCWVHGFNINLDGHFENHAERLAALSTHLMYSVRGWRAYSENEVAALREEALQLIDRANELIGAAFDRALQRIADERRGLS